MENAENPNLKSRRQWLFGLWRATEIAADDSTQQSGPEESNSSIIPRSELYYQHFSHAAMACQFQLFVNLGAHPQAAQAAIEAFHLIDQLEDQLSIYRDISELTLVNRFANTGWIDMSADLFDLLQMGQQLAIATAGAFDLTATPLSRAWGFFDRRGQIISPSAIDQALARVGYQHLEFDEPNRRIRFLRPNMELNVHSIGKGFALDRATQRLQQLGLSSFALHGGQSSVITRGHDLTNSTQSSEQQGWTVGLSHPLTPATRLAEIRLRDESLGTSGTARQGFYYQGRRFGHIIDPRTGWPADKWLSVTVIHRQAALADALATAFFVMDSVEIETFCREQEGLKVILIAKPNPSGEIPITTFNLGDDELTCRLWQNT